MMTTKVAEATFVVRSQGIYARCCTRSLTASDELHHDHPLLPPTATVLTINSNSTMARSQKT